MLQRGRAQLSAEMVASHALPAATLDASTGPRSIERGDEGDAGDDGGHLRLQRGRAQLSAEISATETKWGQSTVNKGSLVGNYAILLYSQPNPGLYDPSAFKCFSTNDALVDGVRQYREESARSEVYAVDWSEDMKLCSTLCARLLAIS